MFSKFRYHLTGISFVILAAFIAFVDYLWLGTDYKSLYSFLLNNYDNSQDLQNITDDSLEFDESGKIIGDSTVELNTFQEKLVCVIESGDTLKSILTKVGLDSNQTEQALNALVGKINPHTLKIGNEISIKLEKNLKTGQKTLISMILPLNDGEHRTCFLENEGGCFKAIHKIHEYKKIIKHAQGSVQTSFYTSAVHKGVPVSIVKKAVAALSYDINMQLDPKKGDKFEIVYTAYVDKNNKVAKVGDLKYVAFAPGGKLKRIYSYETKPGHISFFDEKGHGVVKTFLKTPLMPTKMNVTSKFNLKGRMHPVLGYSRAHKGVDYGAPRGTPVMASASGVVLTARYSPSYGNHVKIRHANGYETLYAHLSKIFVKRGQIIKQQHKIGTVGSTGIANGPHLHYEVIHHGHHIDPQKLKQSYIISLKGQELDHFRKSKSKIDEEIAGLASGNQYAHNDSLLLK